MHYLVYFVNFMNSVLIIIVKLHKPLFLIIDEQICDFLELLESHPKASLSLCHFRLHSGSQEGFQKNSFGTRRVNLRLLGAVKNSSKANLSWFFSASQCQSRSRPKEGFLNETSKFVI